MHSDSTASFFSSLNLKIDTWCDGDAACSAKTKVSGLIAVATAVAVLGWASLRFFRRDNSPAAQEIIAGHEFQKVSLGAACGVLAVVTIAAWSFALIQLPTLGIALAGCGLCYLCAVTVDKALTEEALERLR